MSKTDRQIKLAERMIRKYGQAVTWQKQSETVNEAQPWKAVANEPAKYPCHILFLRPGSGLAKALIHLLKGTDVPAGGPRGLMAAQASFIPQITDAVVRDGKTLAISTIDPLAPNGIVIYYEIQFV